MMKYLGVAAGAILMIVMVPGWASEKGLAPVSPDDVAKVRQAFEQVNGRFDRLASLQYQVERKTTAKGITVTEQWSFLCTSQGVFRIDYRKPEKRVFMSDGQVFTEYLPTMRKALRTPLSGDGNAANRIASVLKRLSVDGLRVGDEGNLLEHLSFVKPSPGQPAVLVAEGRDPRYAIQIDTNRFALISFEKWDTTGRLELSIRADGFSERAPGFWLPSVVRTIFFTQDGKSEVTATISKVMVNKPVPKDSVDFTLPADVEIIEADGK